MAEELCSTLKNKIDLFQKYINIQKISILMQAESFANSFCKVSNGIKVFFYIVISSCLSLILLYWQE